MRAYMDPGSGRKRGNSGRCRYAGHRALGCAVHRLFSGFGPLAVRNIDHMIAVAGGIMPDRDVRKPKKMSVRPFSTASETLCTCLKKARRASTVNDR
jgi:hypothetical protein